MNNLTITYTGNYPVLSWLPCANAVSYNIYRGVTKDSMEKIGISTGLQYQDNSEDANIMIKFDRVKWLYKISYIDSSSTEHFFTEEKDYVQDIQYPYYGVLKEIVRRNNLMLNNISGENVIVYLKKGEGEYAEETNTLTGDIWTDREMADNRDSIFEGGWYKVPNIYIRVKNAPFKIIESDYGQVINSSKNMFMSTYPIINSGDFVKTLEGKIFLIDTVVHRRFRGFLTLQTASIKELMTTHPYYSIE